MDDPNEQDLQLCTPTFTKHYTRIYEYKLNNEILGINYWFYFGYPDVAVWFEENFKQIENACNLRGYYLSAEREDWNLDAFRFAVDEIKTLNRKLECAI